jgi:hypothetical protein
MTLVDDAMTSTVGTDKFPTSKTETAASVQTTEPTPGKVDGWTKTSIIGIGDQIPHAAALEINMAVTVVVVTKTMTMTVTRTVTGTGTATYPRIVMDEPGNKTAATVDPVPHRQLNHHGRGLAHAIHLLATLMPIRLPVGEARHQTKPRPGRGRDRLGEMRTALDLAGAAQARLAPLAPYRQNETRQPKRRGG